MPEPIVPVAPEAPPAAPPATPPAAPPAKVPETPAGGAAPVASDKNPDGSEKKTPSAEEAAKVKKDGDAPDPAKPFLIKVDGKDQWYSKDEIVRMAQKGMGADKRFQEAHKMKSAADSFLWLLKNKPMEILNNPKLGIDFKKLASDYISDEINLEMMTPEQRELHDAKKKLAAHEEEKKLAKEKGERDQMDALVKQHNENYERDITETLKTSGLPKTRETVRKIAYYLSEALKQDVVLKSADVIHLVKADYEQSLKDLFQSVDGDALMAFLGDDNVKKLNEALIRKVKGGEFKAPKIEDLPAASSVKQPVKVDKEQWRKEVDLRVAALT